MRENGFLARWLQRRAPQQRDTAPPQVQRGGANRPAPELPSDETGWSWPEVAQCEGRPGEVVELPDSAAEPGGPPVRVDPGMVSPAGAERMRPLTHE